MVLTGAGSIWSYEVCPGLHARQFQTLSSFRGREPPRNNRQIDGQGDGDLIAAFSLGTVDMRSDVTPVKLAWWNRPP